MGGRHLVSNLSLRLKSYRVVRKLNSHRKAQNLCFDIRSQGKKKLRQRIGAHIQTIAGIQKQQIAPARTPNTLVHAIVNTIITLGDKHHIFVCADPLYQRSRSIGRECINNDMFKAWVAIDRPQALYCFFKARNIIASNRDNGQLQA